MNLNNGIVGAFNFEGSVNPDFGSITCTPSSISFVADGSKQAVKNSGVGYIRGSSPVGFGLSVVSIAMRIRIDGNAVQSYLLGKLTFGGDNNYAVLQQYFGTQICFYGSNFTSADSQATEILGASDGQFHYIVYTYDGVTVNGYLDSIHVVTAVINKPMVTSPGPFHDDLYFFTFDQITSPGSFISNATIASTYIYNRILSPSEVTFLSYGYQYPFPVNNSSFLPFFK